jgi:hypothetical protein
LFDPNNAFTAFNQQLHSNGLYNVFQFSVSALAVFSAGAYQGLKSTNPVCFVAGTMILTAAGVIAIENIKAGDKVISTNPETKETGEKTVLQAFVNDSSDLVHITVNGEEIVSTPMHKFYVPNSGWIPASALKAGTTLVLANGSYADVESIRAERLKEPVKVYNFEVADWHTYYVGEVGVLVHNDCVRPKSGGVENPDGTTTYTKKIDGKDVSVTYSEGKYADFSPHAETLPNGQKSVTIEYSGSRSTDFRLADKAAGYTKTNPRPTGYTWDHTPDMKTMQLVNSKIHNVSQGGFPHAGGIDIYQKLTGIKYRP